MSGVAPRIVPSSAAARLGDRIVVLDGVRGLAILLVMMCHFTMFGGMQPELFVDKLYYRLAIAGWSGVDLFFVLSGFLITGILVDAKGSSDYFRNFYVRRVLRIFPLYYAVLVLFFVIWPQVAQLDGDYQDLVRDQAWYWTYLANVQIAWQGWPAHLSLGHFWSLAVEEQFYLVWPALVFLAGRRGMIRICIGCMVVALLLRLGHAWTGYGLPAYVLTSSRLDALALGGLLAILARNPGGLAVWRPVARMVAITTAIALAGIGLWRGRMVPEDPVVYTIGFTLLALFFGALLVLTVTATRGSPLVGIFSSRSLCLLGRYSYGLYVFHHLVVGELRRESFRVADYGTVLGSQLPVQLLYSLAAGAITLAIAAASWHLFESRVLGLKTRFPYAQTSRLARATES